MHQTIAKSMRYTIKVIHIFDELVINFPLPNEKVFSWSCTKQQILNDEAKSWSCCNSARIRKITILRDK